MGTEHVQFSYDAGGERTVKYSTHGETVYVDKMYQVQTSRDPDVVTKHIFVGTSRLVSTISNDNEDYHGDGGELYFYHADHLGSSNYITDKFGDEYEHMEFTPYGETWVNEGRDSLDRIEFMFTGKELDEETGLYYFGARYLDPKTSRWLSVDPALGEYMPVAPVSDEAKKHNGNLPGMGGAFNPVNLAVYHYGGNNPIKYVDPNGRENILEMFIRWAMGRPHSGLWQQNPRMAMMELQMGRSIIKLSHAITANVETRIALNGSITLLTGKIIITQSHDKMSIGVRGGLNIPKLGPIVGKVIEVGFDFILHDDDKLSFEFSDIKHGVDINIPQGGLVTGTIQGRINNEGEVELRFLEKVGIADNPVASANLEVGVNIKASKLLEELGKKDY